MIAIILDAVVFIIILKVMDDADVSLFTAFFVALGASILTVILALGLGALIGVAGILIAAVIMVGLLGVLISALFGIEIKRSFIMGGIFMLMHLCISYGLSMLFQ